jgi:hypothetical protein
MGVSLLFVFCCVMVQCMIGVGALWFSVLLAVVSSWLSLAILSYSEPNAVLSAFWSLILSVVDCVFFHCWLVVPFSVDCVPCLIGLVFVCANGDLMPVFCGLRVGVSVLVVLSWFSSRISFP